MPAGWDYGLPHRASLALGRWMAGEVVLLTRLPGKRFPVSCADNPRPASALAPLHSWGTDVSLRRDRGPLSD